MTPTFKVINTSADATDTTDTGEVFLRMSLALHCNDNENHA